MPVTLAQEIALEMPKTRKAVLDTMVRTSPLYNRIPFETIGALNITAPYISSIPTIPFRHLNASTTEVSVSFTDLTHSLAILDADIDIDPVIMDIKNKVQNSQVAQAQNTVKAISYQLVDNYVNGDVTSDTASYDGLLRHLTTNSRFNGQTENATGNSTELNLAVGTAADSDYRSFWHKMNLAGMRINFGHGLPQDEEKVVILSNAFALAVMEASLRQLGLYADSKDSYDRTIMTWKGADIIDAGWDPGGAIGGSLPSAGNAGDFVIGYDSTTLASLTNNGANAYDKTTPLYFIRFGENYNMGLQQTPMVVKNLGEIHTSPHYNRTNVRWVVNPAVAFQKRAWSVLFGCNFSGTTA